MGCALAKPAGFAITNPSLHDAYAICGDDTFFGFQGRFNKDSTRSASLRPHSRTRTGGYLRIWALESRRIRLKAACRSKQFREGRLRLCSCHVLRCPMDGDCTIGSACGHSAGCGQTSSRRPQPVTVWRRLQSSLRHDQCSRRAVGHRVYSG